jgi:hypothetical protein
MSTDELKPRAKARLRAIIDRYTAGEAEVVRTFFSRPRTREEYLDMTLRQMGREAIAAHWLHRLGAMGDRLEHGVGRWELYGTLQHMADEIKHYALLADVAEWVAGRKLTGDELRRYEAHPFWEEEIPDKYLFPPLLPEAARMVEVTRELMAQSDRAFFREVVELTEGGGGGAFIEASRARADEFQRRYAAAMEQIVADEMRHGPEKVDGFVEAHIQTEADLARAADALTAFMAQHLRLRNEIYGCPLAEERLAAIGRGEVGPPPQAPVKAAAHAGPVG